MISFHVTEDNKKNDCLFLRLDFLWLKVRKILNLEFMSNLKY